MLSFCRFSLLFILLILWVQTLYAQQDSSQRIPYTRDYEFEDGFYLNFKQMSDNKPVPKARILTDLDMEQPDFLTQIVEQDSIMLYSELGTAQTIKTSSLWGYCQNGNIYIRYGQGFNRIPIIGHVAHFVAQITTTSNYPYPSYNPYSNYYSPYNYYPYGMPYSTKVEHNEVKQLLIDLTTGMIYDYNVKSVEVILMKDAELYDEYQALRKRKKRQLMYVYIRKYNDRNPLYVPVKE